MESYEEAMFDQIREEMLASKKSAYAISKESGVSYAAVSNIMKGNKSMAYRAETYGRLKDYLKLK